jgi:tripartite motif-containing protein 71
MPSGRVYVSDNGNCRIQKFTSDGTFALKWGTPGIGDGQFYHPSGVAVDASGNVYVTDQDNHRIQVFTSGGAYLTQWGSYGTGNGQFNGPTGVAVGVSSNAVYVAEGGNARIQVFDATTVPAKSTSWGRIKALYR